MQSNAILGLIRAYSKVSHALKSGSLHSIVFVTLVFAFSKIAIAAAARAGTVMAITDQNAIFAEKSLFLMQVSKS
jgi:hypothetical protein